MSDRAVEHLLANCAVLSAAQETERKPVFDRLRDLLGADLTRLLIFGLATSYRFQDPRRSSAP